MIGFIASNPVIVVISIITTIGALISIACTIFSLIFGLAKPVWRFGLARWRKKVFIAGNQNNTELLKKDLITSGIVRKRNIETVSTDELNRLNDSDTALQIVCSGDIPEDRILRILESKKSTCGTIVYAKSGSLEKEKMQEINRSHHVSVVNMRGRLANEVIVMLLATSFTRKDALSQ